jgi:hypothetical protein
MVPVNMMFLNVRRGSDLHVNTFTGTYNESILKDKNPTDSE